LETVRIKQEGFIRLLIPDFKGRYRFVAPKADQKKIFGSRGKGGIKGDKEQVKQLVQDLTVSLKALNLEFPAKDIILGITKVFIKRKASYALERGLDAIVIGHLVNIQRIGRGNVVRKKLLWAKEGLKLLIAFLDKNAFYAKPGQIAIKVLKSTDAIRAEIEYAAEAIKKSEMLPKALAHPGRVKRIATRMEKEAALIDQMFAPWPTIKMSMDPVEIQKFVAPAEELEIPDLEPLWKRLSDLKIQLPLMKIMQDAMESKGISDLQEAHDQVSEKKLRKDDWIPELKGYDMAAELLDVLAEMKAIKRLKKAKNKLQKIKDKRKKELNIDPLAEAGGESLAEPQDGEVPPEEVCMESQDLGTLAQVKAATDTTHPFSFAPANKLEDEDSDDSEMDDDQVKGRERTLTGFSPEQCEETLELLEKAGNKCDVKAMEKAFSLAVVQNISAADLEESEKKFISLHKCAFVSSLIMETSDKAKNPDPEVATAHVLQVLKNLLKQAKYLGLPEESYTGGFESLQKGVRARVHDSVRGSIFQSDLMKDPEMQLVEETFSDLYKFPGLKNPQTWKGHDNKKKPPKGCPETMLSHSKNKIKEPLTQVRGGDEKTATFAFCDVQGWMLDLATPESQRLGLSQALVEIAKASTPMADEIYVQVLKQLTRNPSKRSTMLGWQLLHVICQNVIPSQELQEFVRTYLVRVITGHGGVAQDIRVNYKEICAMATQCMKDLNIAEAPTRVTGKNQELFPVVVLLIDGSTRKVHVLQTATLVELAGAMNEQLKVQDKRLQDFSFFHLIDGKIDGRHRLLPVSTVVEELLANAGSGGRALAGNLLYKRRFLTPMENLHFSDVAHANLTYAQAFFEYIHYPINENADFMCQIAATIMCLEADHYTSTSSKMKLKKENMLEQLLPKCMVPEAQKQKRDKIMSCIGLSRSGNKQRLKYAQQLADTYAKLKKAHDPAEPRLLQMSRTLALIQKLSFVGSSCWAACPLSHMSEDRTPLPKVEASSIETAGADYFMFVDVWGLRFVACLAKHKEWAIPKWAFLFNEMAPSRIVKWGAKDNVIQFIIEEKKKPGVKFTLFVDTPEASHILHRMDICFEDGETLAKERIKLPKRRAKEIEEVKELVEAPPQPPEVVEEVPQPMVDGSWAQIAPSELLPGGALFVEQGKTIGEHINVVSTSGKVRCCTIVDITDEQLKIHYSDFDDVHDEWLQQDSERITSEEAEPFVPELTPEELAAIKLAEYKEFQPVWDKLLDSQVWWCVSCQCNQLLIAPNCRWCDKICSPEATVYQKQQAALEETAKAAADAAALEDAAAAAALKGWRRASCQGMSDLAAMTAKPEKIPDVPLREREVPLRDFELPEGRLIDLLKLGAIKLVRGQWLIELEAKGEKMPRSQDAPEDAFWNAEEATKKFIESDAMSSKIKEGQHAEIHCLGLFFYAMSYCWIDRAHPDPKGFHLKRMATLLKGIASARQRLDSFEDVGVFVDFLSLSQEGANGEPRSPAEQELFQDALTGMPVIYGHDLSLVLEMKAMPPCPKSLNGDGQYLSEDGRWLAYDYADRGWTFFEGTTAGARGRVFGSRLEIFDDCSFRRNSFENLEDWWGVMHKFGAQGVTYHPDDFEETLKSRTFAKPEDSEIVGKLYRKMYDALKQTEAQHFSYVIWTTGQLTKYAAALREFDSLQLFDMNQCQIRGDEGVVMICQALSAKTTLHSLAFDRVSLTDAGVKVMCHSDLWPANLTFLSLGANGLTDDAAFCMAGELPHRLQKLKDLRVSFTKITTSGHTSLLLSLPHCKVTY